MEKGLFIEGNGIISVKRGLSERKESHLKEKGYYPKEKGVILIKRERILSQRKGLYLREKGHMS